jgi:hypothetical protein
MRVWTHNSSFAQRHQSTASPKPFTTAVCAAYGWAVENGPWKREGRCEKRGLQHSLASAHKLRRQARRKQLRGDGVRKMMNSPLGLALARALGDRLYIFTFCVG